jgi:putative ABC transport system substrate-binding protein
MISRRRFITDTVIALMPIGVTASAQGRTLRIGWLDAGMTPTKAAPSRALTAFGGRLKELGWVEGRNVMIESRFADTYWDRLPGLAQELVAREADVIVTIGTATVMAAKKATTTIPIVMAGAGEPLELGLVSSLARPGGNVTGVAHNPGPEFAGKSLEVLKDAAPNISRVAVLWDSNHARVILSFLSTQRMPSMFQDAWFVEQGALFSHYANWASLRRRTAEYVDKILKGAKPGDLPVEQPAKFELVINLKTAKALGLTIPQSLLVRADEIIQ